MMNRWLMLGKIITLSPLQIRTGEKESNDEGSALAIEADNNGFPFIPGSSLKGAIRSRIVARFKDVHEVKNLLGAEPYEGTGRSPDRDGEMKLSLGGLAEFLDCRAAKNTKKADQGPSHTQTRIERRTRTADDASLRTSRSVQPGTVFGVEVMIDRASSDEICLLLAGFCTLDGGSNSVLGGGKGIGRGICEFRLQAIHCMDDAAILSWMKSDSPRHWRNEIMRHRIDAVDQKDLQGRAQALLQNNPASVTEVAASTSIVFSSPFLVAKAANKNNSGDDREADLTPLKDADDNLILPGSSLRGALRSQAERIVRTVHPGNLEPHPLIVELFGDTSRAGALRFTNFTNVGDDVLENHEFVAVDRFSGGARDGAKFTIRAAQQPTLEGIVRLKNKDTLSEAARGLLWLLHRDAAEGDILLGYGSTKGFARCTFDIGPILNEPDTALVKKWIEAFRSWSLNGGGEVAA